MSLAVASQSELERRSPTSDVESSDIACAYVNDDDSVYASSQPVGSDDDTIASRTKVVQDRFVDRFRQLVSDWKENRPWGADIVDVSMHEAYQSIIGMGYDAVPLILRELQREQDHWFWALNAITGENPIKEEHEGILTRMAHDWIEWGRSSGLI